MIMYEYSVKVFQTTITVIAFDIEDVAKNYPSAENITRTGTHFFIGDGGSTAQTLTKATPIAAAFTGSSGASSGSSHDAIPTNADLSVASPATIAFVGPAGCSSYLWELAGYSSQYGQNITTKLESAGTYVMKLTPASDGGEAAPHYMKITVT